MIQRRIQAGFAAALAFLLLAGASAWWSMRRNVETSRELIHAHEVIDLLDDTLAAMLDTETGMRGYAISGDETFLAPYQTGTAAVEKTLAAAQRLTRDNPEQQRRLAALESLIQKRISHANEVVGLRRSGDTAGALQLIASGQGKQTMDEIRKVLGEIEAAEKELLHLRMAQAQALSRTTMAIVAFACLLALGLVSLAGVMVRRDFEKRQQAEAERDRFFTLSLDLLAIANTDGYFKRVNPAFTLTLGWSAEELLARPFLDFVHPDDRAATRREVEKLAAGQPTLHFENRYRCKDGSWKWLSWHTAPQPDGTLYAVARDTTELKLAEENLRRSEENLAVTLNSIGDAVMATDAEGRVTRLNPVAEKLTGWTQVEAQGRPVAEVFRILNEETRKPALIPVEKVLATGEIHGLANHTLLIARDGTERPIADSAAPIRDQDGRILGVVLVFRDVTEERRAEREIRRLNEGLEELVAQRTADMRRALATLDAMEDGAFIFDPETLLHTYVNEGAVRQLGYTQKELLSMTPLDFKPEFTEAGYRELITPMLRGEVRTRRFTTLHRRKDGHDFPVEISLQYVALDGERGRFIAIARDITERVKHERLLFRSQRLESIGSLAAGLAHDLNNAIAPIMMGVEMLRMQYPAESPILDTIQDCSRRCADMVRQLLTFAKGAEGERTPVSLGRLIRELERLMKGSFPKNIQLVVKSDPNLPPVLGDATQLHQVLLNLCVNARDAMPHGGTLILETQRMEVDAAYASSVPDAKPGQYIALRVRDTGVGIPPDILDRIFDPFFTTKGPDQGTGLGLSTVLGIVKGHSGFIHVYSKPGQGSTFTVFLPLADGESNDTIPRTRVPVVFRGQDETILFVDDEPAVRQMARALLRHLNFTPLIATNGADGVMQAAQHRAELRAVITDLHMPHMDGLALVRALRRMLPDIPIVVASGRMEDALAEEFKTLGVTHRLDKPFTEAQLAEVLRNIFGPR